jgi:hypothetical protein
MDVLPQRSYDSSGGRSGRMSPVEFNIEAT